MRSAVAADRFTVLLGNARGGGQDRPDVPYVAPGTYGPQHDDVVAFLRDVAFISFPGRFDNIAATPARIVGNAVATARATGRWEACRLVIERARETLPSSARKDDRTVDAVENAAIAVCCSDLLGPADAQALYTPFGLGSISAAWTPSWTV